MAMKENSGLQAVCKDVVEATEGALGCILVDLSTGLALAAGCRPGRFAETEVISLVAAVGVDMFRGKLVRQIQQSLPSGRDAAAEFVREVQLTLADAYQFMSAIPDWEDVILVVVTDKTVNIGSGWMVVHQAVRRIQERPASNLSKAVEPMGRPPSAPGLDVAPVQAAPSKRIALEPAAPVGGAPAAPSAAAAQEHPEPQVAEPSAAPPVALKEETGAASGEEIVFASSATSAAGTQSVPAAAPGAGRQPAQAPGDVHTQDQIDKPPLKLRASDEAPRPQPKAESRPSVLGPRQMMFKAKRGRRGRT